MALPEEDGELLAPPTRLPEPPVPDAAAAPPAAAGKGGSKGAAAAGGQGGKAAAAAAAAPPPAEQHPSFLDFRELGTWVKLEALLDPQDGVELVDAALAAWLARLLAAPSAGAGGVPAS